MSSLETHYSANDIEARILAGIRAAGLNPEQRLSPEELGALDHFHTGGQRASRELLEVVPIRAEDSVLDIGAGLAGSAKLVSAEVMHSVLGGCGFITELLEDTSDTHLSRTIANATPAVPGQLGLAVFVDNLAQKAANARRSLEEGQVRLVRGVFRVIRG
jgi:hypothetical protein